MNPTANGGVVGAASVAPMASSTTTPPPTYERKRLFITHVDSYGPYLKISGHLNPDAVNLVRSKLHQLLPTCYAIDPSCQAARQQELLRPGTLCLFKRTHGAAPADYEFLRARVCNVIQGASVALAGSLQVEADFIDYGYNALVSSYELLFPQHPELLRNIPPLCTQYIALGICTDWKKSELDEVIRMIMHQTLEICIEMEFKQFKFISMKWKEFNFAEFLIHQKQIGAPIANNLLRDSFIKIVNQHPKQQQLQQQQQEFYNGSSNSMLVNNNNNISTLKNNNNSSNNNNNYYHNNNINNNNGLVASPAAVVSGAVMYPAMGVGVAGASVNPYAGAANQVREQMATRRSLAARLQQHQLQQQQQQNVAMLQQQNAVMQRGQPRMPHTIGNLRSMMQGQNYAPIAAAAPIYNGANMLPPPHTAQLNSYNARYQRPQAPQPLLAQQQLQQQSQQLQQHQLQQQQHHQQLARVNSVSATFKSNNLSVGKLYDVCISYVENGPCLFSVQLVSAQQELTEMMNEIEKVPLQQFNEKPMLGTACIARYSEDGQLYRALITAVQPTACKVAYIDYGNAELVNFGDLYEIPEEFLNSKAYAIRFTLSGHKELEPIDESLKRAFKDLVIYKNCQLRVMPLEGPPLVQYCELYMQDKSALDILKQIQKCRLVYAQADALQNNDIVEIRYIDSPKHFYVQKVANIAEFETLMDDMFLYYNKNQVVPQQLTLGAPCIVKYDKEWYRAEVMRADSTAIIVRHVDFGYEQIVTKNLLSNIAEHHLKLPRQAVQCCLKGFEHNELNKDLATTQFEMLAEESNRKRRSFTVKVFRIQPDGVNLVNLCTKDLNVMKKLYKLSMPFDQYLSMEKEEFNERQPSTNGQALNGGGGRKTPSSIASSNDAHSVHSHKKTQGHILNSTTLQSDEWQQQQLQLQQHQQPQLNRSQQSRHNQSSASGFSTEWDKQSSAGSSMDNRDSRSSSSEYKQGRRGHNNQHQQRQRHQQQQHNLSIASSSDRRSNGSGSMGGAGYNNNKQQRGNAAANNLPPRLQKQQDQENRRPHKQSNMPQVQRNSGQRSQNAPQGYSQPQQRHKLGGGSGRSSKNPSGDEHLNSSSSGNEQQQPEEYVPYTQAFPRLPIETPAREDVTICWWISPHQFYTHLKSRTTEFERLMRRMQQFYKQKPHQQLQLKVGSYVVARYRKDNILYRARIIACNQMLRKYKVFFVDFGSQYTVSSEDLWPVEKRFAELPCMAHLCAFNGIISNVDHLLIIDRMEKYLPTGSKLTCEYIERVDEDGDLYYVNVNVNKMSLRETLKLDGLISDVSPELRLDLLPGQQIRAKISCIKDMLNFKIQIEGCDQQIKFLCSYNDVRYVKSNPDVAQKFKQFYEGKSCVVNIVDLTDNKVILLRPLLPLLHDDIPSYICTYPIILESFNVRIVHVESGQRLYAHMISVQDEMAQLLDDMFAYYANGTSTAQPLKNIEPDQLCAANGSDGNWYRARIVTRPKTKQTPVEVKYIDYGNNELLAQTQLKQLAEQFYVEKSSFAIEINLPIKMNETATKNKNAKTEADEGASALLQELKTLTLEQLATVKAIEMRRNRLIADLWRDGQSLMQLLQQRKLIKGKDVEAMRRQLDKEPANVLEHIETVDLTLEDEELEQQQPQSPSKSNQQNSPKKKKLPALAKAQQLLKALEQPKLTEAPKTATPQVALKPDNAKPSKEEVPKVNEKPANEKPTKEELPNEKPSKVAEPVVVEQPLVVAASADVVAEIAAPAVAVEVAPVIDPYADMLHATLSHCDNPTRFFVHAQHKLSELRGLQENLQIVAASLPPLMNVINGAHCISLYSVDKQWYRARIMDAELMVLQFIDYGNTDALTDTSDIKEMSVFPDIAPYCTPCALAIRPQGSIDWVDAANALFNDSYQKTLHYECLTEAADEDEIDAIDETNSVFLSNTFKRYIRLYIDGIDVAQHLIEAGYAQPLQLVENGASCYISHVNALNDFYIQYEQDSKALELIEIYLADEQQICEPITCFEPLKIVAALFADDGMWYRAQLLSVLPDDAGFEVLFIDYGNTSVSTECRTLSPEIAALQPLSKPCALQLPARCVSWSAEAETKFAEISALGETVFNVQLRTPAATHAYVQLLIDGRNIVEDLAPLCEQKPLRIEATNNAVDLMTASFLNASMMSSISESRAGPLDAIISHSNAPSDFYLQFNKDAVRLEDMTNTLNTLGMEPLATPVQGQLCAAVYEEDGALYRARILNIEESKQCRVLFIDFGNEALATELRALPQDLLQLRPFARRCQLAHDFSTETTDAATVNAAFDALIDACQGLVQAELLDDESHVNLLAANTKENLCAQLLRQLANANSADGASTAQERCIITHAYAPTHFYIQLLASTAKMELIKQTLQQQAAEQPLLPATAALQSVCCVYVAEDECYYRARINSVRSDASYVVQLFDFGNCVEATQLRELPVSLRAIPAQALKCQLNGIEELLLDATSGSSLDEPFAALLEAHFGEVFELQSDVVIDADQRLHSVQLVANYKDLAEELRSAVESGNAHVAVLSPVPTLHNCSVIHVDSPASFYIQLAADVSAVEQLTDVLLDAETDFAPFTDLAVGALCAAQFPDDGAFYRARIVRRLLDDGGDDDNDAQLKSCEVHYIDFGNNAVTTEFRQLPPPLLQLPGYSKHCALEKHESLLTTPAAVTHFQTLIDSRFSETFQVELLQTACEPHICRLFYQDKNVATELQQLLKQDEEQLVGATAVNAVATESVDSAMLEVATGDETTMWQTQLSVADADAVAETQNPSSGVGSMLHDSEEQPLETAATA